MNTGVTAGIAPGTRILSLRVLGDDGTGNYTDIIEGIQYAVANKDYFDVRVMNLSLSAVATTPYFADPLNRAVEAAWASGLSSWQPPAIRAGSTRRLRCRATTPTSSRWAQSMATAQPATGRTTRFRFFGHRPHVGRLCQTRYAGAGHRYRFLYAQRSVQPPRWRRPIPTIR